MPRDPKDLDNWLTKGFGGMVLLVKLRTQQAIPFCQSLLQNLETDINALRIHIANLKNGKRESPEQMGLDSDGRPRNLDSWLVRGLNGIVEMCLTRVNLFVPMTLRNYNELRGEANRLREAADKAEALVRLQLVEALRKKKVEQQLINVVITDVLTKHNYTLLENLLGNDFQETVNGS